MRDSGDDSAKAARADGGNELLIKKSADTFALPLGSNVHADLARELIGFPHSPRPGFGVADDQSVFFRDVPRMLASCSKIGNALL